MERIEGKLFNSYRDIFKLLHNMIIYDSRFDLGMIRLLRIMVANLIRKNPDLEIQGLHIDLIRDPSYSSMADYV